MAPYLIPNITSLNIEATLELLTIKTIFIVFKIDIIVTQIVLLND